MLTQNKKLKIFSILTAFALICAAAPAYALQMPQNANDMAQMFGISAQAYVVADTKTGQIIIDKNGDVPRTPASLTKLVTAMVVLDTKPRLTKVVTMLNADQIAGDCTTGGACIKSRSGVQFTVDGLFHAALLPSANNAAHALARSTGLSNAAFVARMNAKAKALGATNTHFYEPTGLDPRDITTAADYEKILSAAFSKTYLRNIAQLDKFTLVSRNNRNYTQVIKNSDKLAGVAGSRLTVLGAKTGYLNESKYNFAAVVKYNGGAELSVVVLGEDHLYIAFNETEALAKLAQDARELAANQLTSFNP